MKKILILCMMMFSLVFLLSAQGKVHKYVGVKKCKMCHKSKKSGNQYGIWEKNKHSKAYLTLSSEESMKYAKENGIEDPTKEEKCLKCHTTAYGVPADQIASSYKIEEGVSCEACHGPGSDYKSMKVMKDHKLSVQNGLVVPDKSTCVKCHNEENPFHKPFNFEKYSAKIAHPTPEKK